ncbi:MAG: 2-amino-4-hydroxy-6-hydroxymethyldihydropteridine diphosphokinase [Flavobacterium sp.]
MQNSVILSIGTNKGDKLANIKNCFRMIQSQIGNVIFVSNLYLSPSWGFESDDFYNCALLLYTDKTAEKVLEGLQQIEKNLGRTEKTGGGYEARTIDIDIVDFNGQLINIHNLTIPHPQLHKRLFVLLPLKDVSSNYVHPVFQKNIDQLLDECEDKGSCESISELELPEK